MPLSGSFFTVFAAFAFPSVLAARRAAPVVVVLSAATALPTPITAIARMLTPHSHTNPTRLMFRSPVWFWFRAVNTGTAPGHPKYASCTAASSRTSSGEPTAMISPRLSTTMESQLLHHEPDVVLDQEHCTRPFTADALHRLPEAPRLLLLEARGRFVEEQRTRLVDDRPCHLHHAGAADRQLSRRLRTHVAQPAQLEHLVGLPAAIPLPPRDGSATRGGRRRVHRRRHAIRARRARSPPR